MILIKIYFNIIRIRFSSSAIIISPLEVSRRMNFKEPSFNASTTCLDLPIKEVTYAETSSV